ncbi:S-adenosyl-L-methionine-dependent methyltransferase [Cunninghamella echinulata]|nr:S-adenosyl-L-methionine-dependent methyltransferase [Cunninghamella echinulata]
MTTSSKSSSFSSSPIHQNHHHHYKYPLSQDNEEQDRMVAQHYILRTAFYGNDYMATSMTPLLKQGCIVLDMGCGTGTWTMEMSTVYPSSTFIGIDKLPIFPKDIKPKNCHFRTMDLTTLPLPFPDQSVDYIFQRDFNWALQSHQWKDLIKEYLRILKPGGWIELMEMDIETQSTQLAERSFNDKLLYGLSMRQQDPYIARRLPSILAINGFRRVSSQFQSLPLGWGRSHSTNDTSSHSCSEFARATASQYKYLLKSLQPWLSTAMGYPHEKYENILDQLPSEWSRSHAYIKWHNAIAQKPY